VTRRVTNLRKENKMSNYRKKLIVNRIEDPAKNTSTLAIMVNMSRTNRLCRRFRRTCRRWRNCNTDVCGEQAFASHCVAGLDAAGKDGVVRHVLTGMNPSGCVSVNFKQPTKEELAHDFSGESTRMCQPRAQSQFSIAPTMKMCW